MIVPVFLGMAATGSDPACHTPAATAPAAAVLASLVHTIGYLLVTALIAVLVFEKLGLRMLRQAWINFDLIWAVALIATGLITAVV